MPDQRGAAGRRRPTAAAAKTTEARKAVTGSAAKARTDRADKVRSKRAHRSTALRQAVLGLTAAAEVLDDKGKPKANTSGSPTRMWQHAVTGYAHTVPELNAGKMYVGNCLARIRLKVGKRNQDGSVDRIPDGVLDPPPEGREKAELPEGVDEQTYLDALDVVGTIRSPLGGQSELLRSFGEKCFTVGEAYLLPEDSAAGLTFEVLSTQELSKDGGKWVMHNGPGTDPVDVPDGVEPVRVWRPDDVYRRQATSSVRACLEILEELVLLTKLVRSSAISRMALAGILAISEDFDDPIDDEAPDGEQSAEQSNPLLVDIILNGAKAIDDPASAASWLPYLLSGPTELIDKGIKFIEFKHDDAINVVKRREALERLAQGLDLPFEVILGHQGTTFANAQVISEDTFRVHLEPTIQLLCDALTLGILWPALAARAGLNPDQVKEHGYPDAILTVAVTFDATDLIGRPDKTREVVELFFRDLTQSAVKISEVRDVLGLDPDEAPDEKEVARRLDAYRIAHAAKTSGDIGSAAVGQLLDENGDPVPDGLGSPPPPAGAGPVVRGQQAAEGAGVTASLFLADGLAHKIAGAAEMTMERCAEKIGSRIRPKLKGAQLEAAGASPNSELTRVLGPTVVRRLLNGDDPSATELTAFERTVAKWAADAGQRNPGHVARAVGMVLEATIADRLYSAQTPVLEASTLAAVGAGAGAGAS